MLVEAGEYGGWGCLIPFGTVVNLDLKNFASHVSISTKWSDSHISVVSFTPRCFKSAVVSKEFGSECGGTWGEQLSILSVGSRKTGQGDLEGTVSQWENVSSPLCSRGNLFLGVFPLPCACGSLLQYL